TVQIAPGPTSSLEGTAVKFTGSFIDPGSVNDLNYTYAWSVIAPNGQVISGPTGTVSRYPDAVPDFTFTPNDIGTYSVSLAVTDGLGASGTATAPPLMVLGKTDTVTTVMLSTKPVLGSLVIFKVQVSSAAPSGIPPTGGTVAFSVDGVPSSTVPLDSSGQ